LPFVCFSHPFSLSGWHSDQVLLIFNQLRDHRLSKIPIQNLSSDRPCGKNQYRKYGEMHGLEEQGIDALEVREVNARV